MKQTNHWITASEAEYMRKIAEDLEYQLMWGGLYNKKRRDARLVLSYLLETSVITKEEGITLTNMINSSAEDNLDLALALLEQFSTQNSTQHVSNIPSRESQVPELRS